MQKKPLTSNRIDQTSLNFLARADKNLSILGLFLKYCLMFYKCLIVIWFHDSPLPLSVASS